MKILVAVMAIIGGMLIFWWLNKLTGCLQNKSVLVPQLVVRVRFNADEYQQIMDYSMQEQGIIGMYNWVMEQPHDAAKDLINENNELIAVLYNVYIGKGAAGIWMIQ